MARWTYHDEQGAELFRVVRVETAAGKEYPQYHPCGAGACCEQRTCHDGASVAGEGWRAGRGGAPYVLYGLPRLLTAPASERVFVVEGEKCAESLIELGLLATTGSGGASNWRAEYTEALRGRSVVLLPDNDRAGVRLAESAIEELRDAACELRCLLLPGLAPKEDAYDWLGGGGTRERLLELVEAAPSILPQSLLFPKAVDARVLAVGTPT